jgi:ankyrin repeat protein
MMIAKGVRLNAVDNFGRTPLHLLAALGRVNGVTCLLHNGADITIREHINNLTAIDFAMIHGHDDVVKLLMTFGAQPTEINSPSGAQSSAVARADSVNDTATAQKG